MFEIKRLKQALNLVEEIAKNFEIIWRVLYQRKLVWELPAGLAINHRGFRQYLLSLVNDEIDENFSVDIKFLLPTFADDYFGPSTGLHIDIANWVAKSRRVYNLSDDLVRQFSVAPVGDITWQDIKFPFDSFGLSLERPIMTSQGKSFDFIIVSNLNLSGQKMLCFDLLSTELDNFHIMDAHSRQLVSRKIKKTEYNGAFKIMQRFFNANGQAYNSRILLLPELISKEPVTKSIADLGNHSNKFITEERFKERPIVTAEEAPEWDIAANIICGVCLYLSQLSPVSRLQMERHYQAPVTTFDQSAIISAADIYNVSDEVALTESESNAQNRLESAGEKCAHFRRGHWRTINNNGEEKKIIWIKPALVRPDRLPPDSLPAGIVHKI